MRKHTQRLMPSAWPL